MPYETHLMANFEKGLDWTREPWISLPSAWKEMSNAYVFRGRIWKRQGYGWFGELGTQNAENVGKNGLVSFDFTTALFPVLPQRGTDWATGYSVKMDDGAFFSGAGALHDDGNGSIFQGIGPTVYGAIDYVTGYVVIGAPYFTPLPGPIAAGGLNVTYEYRRTDVGGSPTQNAVMGIEGFYPRGGGETLFAFDRRRYWQYSLTEDRFEAQLVADLWTGDPDNFFWTENFFIVNSAGDDALVITNGVDPIRYWNGTALLEMHTDWANPTLAPGTVGPPAYARKIDSALMCFRFKNRCVLLNTSESADNYPQRARWSDVQPTFTEVGAGDISWKASSFKDAPTADWIVSASFLGDDLIVLFERSIWKLRWKDDFQDPFEWERLFETDGSFATMSTVDFADEIVTLGPTGLLATDGRDVVSATEKTPDIALDWNPEAFQYTYGIVAEERRQALFTYTPSGEDYPTAMVALQYEDGAISTYDLGFHCLGYYQFDVSPVWDDYPLDWDAYGFAWDERTLQAGFPAVLAGDRNLQIHTLWSELSDWQPDGVAASTIPFRLLSNRLNPYLQQGRRCRLGFVNIYASTDSGVELKVSLFGDFTGVAYKTATITLDGPGEKIKKRIPVFVDRAFHQIMIEETGERLLRIDGIEIETMPTAPMRSV